MPKFRLSKLADAEMAAIFTSGVDRFGLSTSQDYIRGLRELLHRLALNPTIGRAVAGRIADVRRHPYRRHVIFYKVTSYGIFVARIAPMAKIQNLDQAP